MFVLRREPLAASEAVQQGGAQGRS